MSTETSVTKEYFVSRMGRGDPSVSDGLTRTEVTTLFEEKARELGDIIKERFPEVEVLDITPLYPLIQISMSAYKLSELVQRIQTELDCTLIDPEAYLKT